MVSYPEQKLGTVIKVVWWEPPSFLSFCDKWELQLVTAEPSGRLSVIHLINMYNVCHTPEKASLTTRSVKMINRGVYDDNVSIPSVFSNTMVVIVPPTLRPVTHLTPIGKGWALFLLLLFNVTQQNFVGLRPVTVTTYEPLSLDLDEHLSPKTSQLSLPWETMLYRS